jgi:peptidyl-prolyl cis-trans isomerase C
MMFFRTFLFLCPAACLLAQEPPVSRSTIPLNQSKAPVTMTIPVTPLPSVPANQVIITVGTETLTFAQFEHIVDALPEQYKNFYRGPGRKQFADNVVKVLLLAQEAKRRKLDETPAYQTQAVFQGETVLANLAFAAMSAETKVDGAVLQKYYEDHKADYEQAHARHILVRFQGSPIPVKPGQKDLTDAEALAKTQELLKQIKAGGDFAALATKESDDTSAAQGGDLPTFPHGKMVPSFDQAAFAMAPGQISEPVKSQYGYHIIKLESKETKGFDDVKGEIEKKLRPEQAQKAMEELENKSKVIYDPQFFGPPTPAPMPMPAPVK